MRRGGPEMRTFLAKASVLAVFLCLPGAVLAAGGAAKNLVIVADTRGLSSWAVWLANIYNESHIQFTLFTIIVIPITGLILGLLADLVMRRIGLDLKSRELAEH